MSNGRHCTRCRHFPAENHHHRSQPPATTPLSAAARKPLLRWPPTSPCRSSGSTVALVRMWAQGQARCHRGMLCDLMVPHIYSCCLRRNAVRSCVALIDGDNVFAYQLIRTKLHQFDAIINTASSCLITHQARVTAAHKPGCRRVQQTAPKQQSATCATPDWPAHSPTATTTSEAVTVLTDETSLGVVSWHAYTSASGRVGAVSSTQCDVFVSFRSVTITAT